LIATAVFRFRLEIGGKPVTLKTAVDLTAKNAKIAKKDSYEWIA